MASMNAGDLMKTLIRGGCVLTIENGQLRVRAPRGMMTSELRGLIAEHRDALLVLISDAGRQDDGLTSFASMNPDRRTRRMRS